MNEQDGCRSKTNCPALGKRSRLGKNKFLRQRFDESAAEKHTDQVALVIGAALAIVDRVGGLGQGFGGVAQLLFNLRAAAGEQAIGLD